MNERESQQEQHHHLTIDKIHNEWRNDSVIDPLKLELASCSIPHLHSKYLRLHDSIKSTIRSLRTEYDVLLKDRWLWYEGKLQKESIDEYGWSYDPFDGLSIKTKGQKEIFYKGDTVLKEMENRIDEQEQMLNTVKEILDHIKWRAQNIKNIIQLRMFEAGQ